MDFKTIVGILANPHITSLLFILMSRRHVMQPIIFLMLIVVSLSLKFFFSSRLPPFFLLTLSYVLLKRGRLRCGGG
jgi:hypothetical protein